LVYSFIGQTGLAGHSGSHLKINALSSPSTEGTGFSGSAVLTHTGFTSIQRWLSYVTE